MTSDPGIHLNIANVPTFVNEWAVTREVAKILHSDHFEIFAKGRPLNFRVELTVPEAGSIRNDGTGTLTLPFQNCGYRFLDYVRSDPIKVEGRKLRFYKSNRPPSKKWAQTLAKTPYVNPDLEEEHQNTLRKLENEIRVDLVQFGVFHREDYNSRSRSFSIEWERNYIESFACLSFNYDHKLFLLKLGSSLTDAVSYSVSVTYASVQKIGVGVGDGRPYICFDTLTPPILEQVDFHRALSGDKAKDNRKYKHRLSFLDEGHRLVSPYALHLRLELFNDSGAIGRFVEMCKHAGIADSTVVHFPPRFPLPALKKGFFNGKRLYKLEKQLKTFAWPIAFQIESLLHTGLLNTEEIEKLIPLVVNLRNKRSKEGPGYVVDFLRIYHQALQMRKPTDLENPLAYFETKLKDFQYSEDRENFRSCHVTFTPTRMILEGPYPTQSNRVIRRFQGYEDHFIRVDFRDEDRLQFRWDREVDGTSFLHSRVGGILKEGFHLAGRKFEFLAYSNSALREHVVWFMNPFRHPSEGWVNSAFIRASLGNFEGTPLLKMPSKYAARLAQAFTATDPSVDIARSEWEEVDDLICPKSPYIFTDGLGTISKDLAKRIWRKLCESRQGSRQQLEPPSAFQIRFLGYKGVVAIDKELDRSANGIHMRLRESMKKFEVILKDDESAPIEIAQAFEKPLTAYLNRPLVMVLEDIGVRKEAFLNLQDIAVAEARTISDSIEQFESTLAYHNMGYAFDLKGILRRLQSQYHMDLKSIDTPFFKKLRLVAMHDILRDIKHSARIPIPESYLLVGVVDEGPAYERRGYKNVFCLEEGQIFACIQGTMDSKPKWLEGNATISRSPVTHIGDVQRVRLVGEPPKDVFCAFRHLRNVVVMPSRGNRSLASCLGGGDVDGDLFSVICEETLLPTSVEDPATYDSAGTLELDRDSTIEDICNFVVDYINSDVLGLLSDRLLTIADQSSDGIRDNDCVYLAALCSQAVDYPKLGIPVELGDNIPRPLIRCKPDWHAAEVVSPHETDYYESSRALGHMFRAISLKPPEEHPEEPPCTDPMSDRITSALFEEIQSFLQASAYVLDPSIEISDLFKCYRDELQYICSTHTLSHAPGIQLLEEEVVVGTILAKCSQKRWRKDRIFRMRHHATTLVKDTKQAIRELAGNVETPNGCIRLLMFAWQAWNVSIWQRGEFGGNSFGLLALSIVFDCLDKLRGMDSMEG